MMVKASSFSLRKVERRSDLVFVFTGRARNGLRERKMACEALKRGSTATPTYMRSSSVLVCVGGREEVALAVVVVVVVGVAEEYKNNQPNGVSNGVELSWIWPTSHPSRDDSKTGKQSECSGVCGNASVLLKY